MTSSFWFPHYNDGLPMLSSCRDRKSQNLQAGKISLAHRVTQFPCCISTSTVFKTNYSAAIAATSQHPSSSKTLLIVILVAPISPEQAALCTRRIRSRVKSAVRCRLWRQISVCMLSALVQISFLRQTTAQIPYPCMCTLNC